MNQNSGFQDYRSLALAGVVQAATLVHRIATGEGIADGPRIALLQSITTRHAASLDEVFPDPRDFQFGANIAAAALSGRTGSPEVIRYTLQLLELAGLLQRVPQIVEKLGSLLDGLDPGCSDEAAFARIYQQTISTLGKRIQVTGDAGILNREATAVRIRALLLAGIRMAWLWHQLGGRRWHLVVRRGQIARAMQAIAD